MRVIDPFPLESRIVFSSLYLRANIHLPQFGTKGFCLLALDPRTPLTSILNLLAGKLEELGS